MNVKANYIKKQIKDLLPGDIILHPIYRTDGLMLINKNKELFTNVIEIIKKHMSDNASVLVVNNTSALYDFVNNKIFQTESFITDVHEIFKVFNKHSSKLIDIASYIPLEFRGHTSFLEDSPTNINQLFSEIFSKMPLWNSLENILESEYFRARTIKIKKDFIEMLTTEETFRIWLEEIKNTDDSLMIHSINITCIALLIGLVVELNDPDLLDLSIAALFSNAGFLNIPKELATKIYHTEDSTSIVKSHLETFSNITSQSPYLRKKTIIYGILDSHEFYNGTGYPNKKKGKDISLYGRILHICHHYDAILNGFFSDTVLTPNQAIDAIYQNKEGRFDKDIIKLIIYRTTYFKIGQIYTLSNMQKGMIIGFTDFVQAPHLPIVELENGEVLDLYK